jgi:peptide/nickel transport system substrate-binding protein
MNPNASRLLRSTGWALLLGFAAVCAQAQTTLRIRLDGELKEIDPIWTSSYPVRNHGYLIYDTLFAMDAQFRVQPQMAEGFTVSPDGLSYTITLRAGLKWNDGTPVRAADAVASLTRWSKRDGLGQQMASRLAGYEVVDDRTFRIKLKEPWGLLIPALGKISSTVPFMMPERLAKTEATVAVKEPIGSGPFMMKLDEWVPGSKIVYVRNPHYAPRKDAPSMAAGAKIGKVDRIEWLVIPDALTAVNALRNGEIDYLESVPPDMIDVLKRDPAVKLQVLNQLGKHVQIVLNHHQPPFDNPKVRQAVQLALKQEDYLRAHLGDRKELYQTCASMFFCGTELETDANSERVMKQDFAAARALLKEANYDGTPIVVLHATDIKDQNDWGFVTVDSLRKAGFTVVDATSDWASVASRRANKKSVAEGGWHIFHTGWAGPDMLDPAVNVFASGGCLDKAWFGWPCSEELEKLRAQFASTTDPAERKRIAERVQTIVYDIVTFVPMGQMKSMTATRANVSGLIESPVPFFWNADKKAP